MKKLFAALILLLLLVGRADAAFYANYFTTNANPVAGGGGIVSNAIYVDIRASTRYTNSTPYYAAVSSAVGITIGSGATKNASWVFLVDTNLDGTYDYPQWQTLGVTATLPADTTFYSVTAGGLVPPYAAFRYEPATAGGATTSFTSSNSIITYYGTNSGGSGGSGTTYTNNSGAAGFIVGSGIGTNVSAAQVSAIMATNHYNTATRYATNTVWGTPELGARSTRKPRLGIATYLTTYNGTNINNAGGTNLYCNATEAFILDYMTNAIAHGLLKLGYDSICIEEGWQGVGRLTHNTNNFPSGIPWLTQKARSMGFRIGLYTDLTYGTCCGYWGSGGTNTVAAANLFASWGIDYLHADSCHQWDDSYWATEIYGTWTEEGRRRQFEDMAAALRATNSNIGFTMNMNATPYAPWIGQTMNGWQLAPNGDQPTYWSALQSIEWANLSAAQFRMGHTPSWYPFNYSLLSAGIDAFGNGYYGAAMLTVGGAAMWQSELQYPTDLVAVEGFAPGFGANFMTNANIIRINQDDLFIPPIKSFTNGTIDVWTKPLVGGETAMLVYNRGYTAAQTFTNLVALFGVPGAGGSTYSVPQVTSNTITIPASAFGFQSGEQATFTQVLANTNFAGSEITIPCPSNHCTLWIVSAASPTKVRGDGSQLSGVAFGTNYIDYQDSYGFDSTTVDGTGVSAITHASFGPTPFFSRAGLAQTAANTDATFVIKNVPVWATNATVATYVYSAYAGNVAWTNKPYLEWSSPTGRTLWESANLATITNTHVSVASGTASWTESNLSWARTNAPKTLKIVMLASTNASARYVIGPVSVTFRGQR